MNRTAHIGIAALILFLLVGIGVQYQTLSHVLPGNVSRGFAAFVMLAGRFAFAMFAVDLFRRNRKFAGSLGIVASLVIAGMEAALIGLHAERTDYRVFAWGIVSVSMLIEIMISVYVSGLEAETAPEKAEVETGKITGNYSTPTGKEAEVIRQPKRKRPATGPAIRRKKLAEILKSEPEKTQEELAEMVGVSARTIRADLKQLNGSVV